jgi:hypothetical protein
VQPAAPARPESPRFGSSTLRHRKRPKQALHEKHAKARATSLKELTKVSRHGLKVGRDKNAILLGSEGQHRGIWHIVSFAAPAVDAACARTSAAL